MTEAGTPKLNRHVPREEAQARIAEALREAHLGLLFMDRAGDWADEAAIAARNAINNIIRILEDGK
jgi:hypothetical protein